jgi:ATP-dependent DNA helicase RecG
LIGGISPSNIITHPAVPRYRSLAEAMAALRLAEREGIGVDRMVRDMLAIGRPEPEISELDGPYVRVGLVGGEPDTVVLEFLAQLEPPSTGTDVDALLLIERLSRRGWLDVATAAPVLQRPPGETTAAINRLAAATINGEPVIVPVNGVPTDAPPAHRFGEVARAKMAERVSHLEAPDGRTALMLDWARSRGRISTTEVADLTGLSVPYVGSLLTNLETEGLLAPGRAVKLGRGFFYVPVTPK